ncbi:MAG TPA: hypothetical protein VKR53_03810 [Puia sp.]|nr:hypothetical protein [Puia sp.]
MYAELIRYHVLLTSNCTLLISLLLHLQQNIFMSISTTELIWGLVIAVVLAGALVIVFLKQRKEARLGTAENSTVNTKQLQLQAYERLILLTDRIALPNLITRVNQPGMSAKEMQFFLTQNIKQEFDHNITQRIYVSPESWDAVNKLKEQNILIINQVASFLPENASGHDLNKSLLDLLIQNPKASLDHVVAEALSYEAKNLMR